MSELSIAKFTQIHPQLSGIILFSARSIFGSEVKCDF
jgi:hypothetical protein